MATCKTITRAIAALLSPGRSSAAETWEQDAWRGVTYFRSTVAVERAVPGTLFVAAVDSYAVHLNGVVVGVDSVWTRMQAIPVALLAGDNDIGVRVVNHGVGAGNGLSGVLRARIDGVLMQAATTTDRSLQPWYWTSVPQADAAWTRADVGADRTWRLVQEGAMDTTRIRDLVHPAPMVIAGFEGDVDIGTRDGAVLLKRLDGVNLASRNPFSLDDVVDGDLRTGWLAPRDALNEAVDIDLTTPRLMHMMRVITLGDDEEARERNSLRGYSVQRSHDLIHWVEVGTARDIETYARTEVVFEPALSRYLRLVVTEITDNTQPWIAEIEAYGTGHAARGIYLSEPLDFGSERRKNLGRLDWEAEVPIGTALSLQFRTGETAADFDATDSGWSAVVDTGGAWFPGPEPRRLLQYRVNLQTRDDRRSPALESLRIDWSADDVAVSAAQARVTPNLVPMGVDTTFLYALDLDFEPGDAGVERLELAVPGRAQLGEIGGLQGAIVEDWQSTHRLLTITFDEPLRQDATLRIPVRASTFTTAHVFRSRLFAPGSENPLNVAEDGADSWDLLASNTLDRALDAVRAAPPVVTPNGDGVNDVSYFEFILSRTDTPVAVEVTVHDLGGRLVRRLALPGVDSGAYLEGTSPARWDGLDGDGHPVPPGLYVFRIDAAIGNSHQVEVGTVAVAY